MRVSDETVRRLTEGQGESFTRYITRLAREINREADRKETPIMHYLRTVLTRLDQYLQWVFRSY